MEHEIRIILADDHPLLRRGLRSAMEGDPGLRVVAEVADGEAAVAEIQRLKPAIAVLDVDMPKLDGLAAAREIRKKKLPVELIFLTVHAEEDMFHAAMDLGAKGYVLKDSALVEIVKALRAVAAGEYYVTPSVAAYAFQRNRRARDFEKRQPGMETLTPTERRVLAMVADGHSSKSIAGELFIHYRTVESHRNNICQKLSLHGPNALFKFALQHKSEL